MNLTGSTPEALGFSTQAQLNSFVDETLERATDWINRDRGRDYAAEGDVPLAVDDIAERMAANYLRAMERQRNKSIAQVEGGEMEVAGDEPTMFTPSIKRDIMRLPRKAVYSMTTAGGVEDDL